MEFMPFSSVSDEDFLGFFPKNYDLAYDADGEWVFFKGVWYLASSNEDTDTDPLTYTDDADEIYDMDFAYY